MAMIEPMMDRATTWDTYLELSLLATEIGHAVTILYHHHSRSEGEHSDLRTLTDLHVFRKNGVAYVTAFDDLSYSVRTFRVDRLEIIGTWKGLDYEARLGEPKRRLRVVSNDD